MRGIANEITNGARHTTQERAMMSSPFDEINRAVEDQRNEIAIKPILEVSVA
jgi:hypothetical protein